MTGPRIAPELDDLLSDQSLTPELDELLGEKKKPGFFSGVAEGAKRGFKNTVGVLGNISMDPATAAMKYSAERAAAPLPELPESQSRGQSVGRFLGQVAGELPLNMAAGGALGNIGRAGITRALGPAASKAGAFVKGAIAGLPGNVAAGVATEGLLRPEEVATPGALARTAAFSAFGGIFDGAFGVRAFNQGEAAEKVSQTLAREAATARMSPEASKAFGEKIEASISAMDKLMSGQPAGLRPRVELDVSQTSPGFRDVGPFRGRIPNSEDVSGFAEKLAADNEQRNKYIKQTTKILRRIQKGGHTEKDLTQLDVLQGQIDAITVEINEANEKLINSAGDVRGLFFGGPGKKVPMRALGDQPTPNMNIQTQKEVDLKVDDAMARLFGDIGPANTKGSTKRIDALGNVVESSPTRPGSGDQSPYPYVNPTSDTDPLKIVTTPKVTGTGNKFANLTPAEQHIAERIDFGNKLKQEAEALAGKPKELSFGQQAERKVLNFLVPVREADNKAYDYAKKFLRVNMKAQAALDDALYIPNKSGGYDRGAEGLLPMLRSLGGDAEDLFSFELYAHAKQAVQDNIETPFDRTLSAQLIQEYDKTKPLMKEIYETRYQPYVKSFVDAVEGYELASPKIVEFLRQNPQYAPLTRSIFADQAQQYRFLKQRTNPTSGKAIEPMWQTLYDNTQGMIRSGEKKRVIRALAERAGPGGALEGQIRITDAITPDDAVDILAKIPKDTPEALKEAIVDMYSSMKGSKYNIWMNGKKVGVEIIDKQLAQSLDEMTFQGVRDYIPESFGAFERATLSPVESLGKVEKAITGSYSIYRDLFSLGAVIDAAEVAANSSAYGYKFNPLVDPVKGFLALYKNDGTLKDLAGHSGLLGFRYANPQAELTSKNIEDLIKKSRLSGIKLRVMNPAAAFSEFAGNLSNASRAGMVLRNKDKIPMQKLATMYNEVIGDPAIGGSALVAWSRITGFMRYPMQASVAGFRSLRELGRNPKNIGFALARVGGMLTAPTILHTWLTRNDERIKEYEQDDMGSRFMYLPNFADPDELIAVPKPQGIMGYLGVTVPSRIMREMIDKDPKTAQLLAKAATDVLMPNFVPMTADMIFASATGRRINSAARGPEVVPPGRQGLLPSDAGSANTTNTSKLLAEVTGIDAGRFDNVLRTFMIGTSFNLFEQADYALGDQKGGPPREMFTAIPGVRAVRKEMGGTNHINEFYSEVESIRKTLSSFDRAITNQQMDRATDLLGTGLDKIIQATELDTYVSRMKDINAEMNRIRFDESMTAEQKRKELDEQHRERVDLAKEALEEIRAVKKKR